MRTKILKPQHNEYTWILIVRRKQEPYKNNVKIVDPEETTIFDKDDGRQRARYVTKGTQSNAREREAESA